MKKWYWNKLYNTLISEEEMHFMKKWDWSKLYNALVSEEIVELGEFKTKEDAEIVMNIKIKELNELNV
jgi:hypothetical protein